MLGAIKPQVIVNNVAAQGSGQVDIAVQSLTRPGYSETRRACDVEKIARLPESRGSGRATSHWPIRTTTRREIRSRISEETADCKGELIRASIAPDGKFTITNGRNGFSKSYAARSPQSGS